MPRLQVASLVSARERHVAPRGVPAVSERLYLEVAGLRRRDAQPTCLERYASRTIGCALDGWTNSYLGPCE